ncbi:MAG: 2-iminoacetate synthase ThiH [Opitutales bacterium]
MSNFSEKFDAKLAWQLSDISKKASQKDVEAVLSKASNYTLKDFAILLSEAATTHLEYIAQYSHSITKKYFGKTIALFAPLYFSNQCVNNCKYCGFAIRHKIERKTLSMSEIEEECKAIHKLGFRDILLVSSENPKATPREYMNEAIRLCHKYFPSVSIEIAPSPVEDYADYVKNGCAGLTVFQETYDKEIYPDYHPSGPKKDFTWRLDTPDRGAKAGMRKLGLGPLLGLNDWRFELIAMAMHIQHLYKNYWKLKVGVSLPRMRPYVGSMEIKPENVPTDKQVVQIIGALRILFNRLTITVSTRECPKFRDGVIPVGTTQMSAASSTQPGGYAKPDKSGEQFEISDNRSVAEFSKAIKDASYEVVWKDFDNTLSGSL